MKKQLTLKDMLELSYWTTSKHMSYHRAKYAMYLWTFGHANQPKSVLEIGPGPLGGVLPLIARANRLVGVDPLVDRYRAAGLLPEIEGGEFISMHFEDWQTEERFDAVFAIDALDHGEMGLHLLPKIAGLLNPGGRMYLHLHFRPASRLNEIHDHQMTEEDLRVNLAAAGLQYISETWLSDDIDGTFECPTLVAVYERPR